MMWKKKLMFRGWSAGSLPCLLLLLVIPLTAGASAKWARGVVFLDINRNGVQDAGEKGLPGVPVSNCREVALTNGQGEFKLPVSDETIIYVVKPSGCAFPLNELNLPRFYYIHQPKGSPKNMNFPGVAPTGPLPKKLAFPLYKIDEPENFNAFIIGDPQTKTSEEIDFFRDQIIAAMLREPKPQFYLDLGDIMYDDLSHYDRFSRVTSLLGVPILHTRGNHDTNYDSPSERFQVETFKRHFGPDYYSFNVGKVHFVVLDTVRYHGYDAVKKKSGGYTGYVDDRQLTWLKNDLGATPEDFLVVLSMHIPISVEWDKSSRTEIVNRKQLLEILKPRRYLLALAGHMHYFNYRELGAESDWSESTVFPMIIAGSGCGTWWRGPKNHWGIPLGLGTDGAANGFFIFSFTGNRYAFRFQPAEEFGQEAMRINTPFGRMSLAELSGKKVNVNVFAGVPGTRVSYRLDEGADVLMSRVIMKDIFFEKMLREHHGEYYDWVEATPSSHIWEAPLPEGLEPGLHRLSVTAVDPSGHSIFAFRVFEVEAMKQQTEAGLKKNE